MSSKGGKILTSFSSNPSKRRLQIQFNRILMSLKQMHFGFSKKRDESSAKKIMDLYTINEKVFQELNQEMINL